MGMKGLGKVGLLTLGCMLLAVLAWADGGSLSYSALAAPSLAVVTLMAIISKYVTGIIRKSKLLGKVRSFWAMSLAFAVSLAAVLVYAGIDSSVVFDWKNTVQWFEVIKVGIATCFANELIKNSVEKNDDTN